MHHGIAPPGRCLGDDTDIQLPAAHGRDELRRTCLAEPQTGAWPFAPKGTEELRQKAHGQWPEDADPEMPPGSRYRARALERGANLTRAKAGLMQELLADLRQVNAGTVAAKQLSANLVFDIADTATDRGLLDAEVLCRTPEAAALRGGDDVTHVA